MTIPALLGELTHSPTPRLRESMHCHCYSLRSTDTVDWRSRHSYSSPQSRCCRCAGRRRLLTAHVSVCRTTDPSLTWHADQHKSRVQVLLYCAKLFQRDYSPVISRNSVSTNFSRWGKMTVSKEQKNAEIWKTVMPKYLADRLALLVQVHTQGTGVVKFTTRNTDTMHYSPTRPRRQLP